MHDFASFARLVHDAYAHLYDRTYLQEHPLTRLFGGTSPATPEQVYRLLVEAIDWLRPLGGELVASVEWRRYHHVRRRYLDGLTTEQIARELLVSGRQARRDHLEAINEIAHLLWRRIGSTDDSDLSQRQRSSTPGTADEMLQQSAVGTADRLDVELSILTASRDPTPTVAQEVIRGVLVTVARLAETQQVRLSADLTPPPVVVEVSRTVLRQLLLNLLTELIIHYPKMSVQITLQRTVETVTVTLSSRGLISELTNPVPMKHSDSPAHRLAEPLLPEDALAVCQRLAESQGITLAATTGPSGPELHIILPITSFRTLLVIDDNPDVGLLFERYLAGTSFRSVHARSAERAIQLARDYQPEVVFLDVLMPSPDGWEILQTLRADPATVHLPVVVCSVLPDRALALSLGVTDFLSKPVSRAALLAMLDRLPSVRVSDLPPVPPESSEALPRPVSHPPDRFPMPRQRARHVLHHSR